MGLLDYSRSHLICEFQVMCGAMHKFVWLNGEPVCQVEGQVRAFVGGLDKTKGGFLEAHLSGEQMLPNVPVGALGDFKYNLAHLNALLEAIGKTQHPVKKIASGAEVCGCPPLAVCWLPGKDSPSA